MSKVPCDSVLMRAAVKPPAGSCLASRPHGDSMSMLGRCDGIDTFSFTACMRTNERCSESEVTLGVGVVCLEMLLELGVTVFLQ